MNGLFIFLGGAGSLFSYMRVADLNIAMLIFILGFALHLLQTSNKYY